MRNSIKRFLEHLYLDGLVREVLCTLPRMIGAFQRGFGYQDRHVRERYLREHQVKKLHLGCGFRRLEGWLNSDLLPQYKDVLKLDATRPFPFEEGVFDFIFSEHMIEHISYADGQRMLASCFRLLKPGGTIRLSTPDLAFLIDIYQAEKSPFLNNYLEFYKNMSTPWAPTNEPVYFINNFFRDWDHQFIYDEKTLRASLQRVGFTSIKRCGLNESEHEVLRNLAHEKRMPAGYVDVETFTLEATKPPVPTTNETI